MKKNNFKPLDSLERFELIQAMFPGHLGEDADLGDEEAIIEVTLGIDPESFDELVGRLVMFAPVMSSPLSGEAHHVLGQVTITGFNQQITAIVKREAVTNGE